MPGLLDVVSEVSVDGDRATARGEPWFGPAELATLAALDVLAGQRDPAYVAPRWSGFLRVRGEQDGIRRDTPAWLAGPPAPETTGFGPVGVLRPPARVRGRPGSGGEHAEIGLLSLGWRLEHPALAHLAPLFRHGTPRWGVDHGTRTLGLLAAAGGRVVGLSRGLAPDAGLRLASPLGPGGEDNVARALLALLAPPAGRGGRVILVDVTAHARLADGSLARLPLEVLPVVRALCALAAALGVAVVAPVGRGRGDLASIELLGGRRPFDGPGSGALLVGGVGCWTGSEVLPAPPVRFVTTTCAAGVFGVTSQHGGPEASAAVIAATLALDASVRCAAGQRAAPAPRWRAATSDPSLRSALLAAMSG